MTKTGIVLAAGYGSRLAGSSDATDLKPITPVGGVPLVIRAIQSLETAGCSSIVVVLGFEPEQIEQTIRDGYAGPSTIEFVHNPRFDLANGVSVLAAARHLGNEFILLMADHIIDDGTMERASLHTPIPGGATLLVDYKLKSIFDMDDATKVQEADGLVAKIGKDLKNFNCVDTGVFVCTSGLLEALQLVLEKAGDASITEGVRLLSRKGVMQTLNIGDGFWQDVDTPEMLAHAEKLLALKELA